MLIAYYRDCASDRAAAKLAERLIAEGIEALRVRFPKGMDGNTVGARMTPARQRLGLMLQQAEWIGRLRTEPDLAIRPGNFLIIRPTELGECEPDDDLNLHFEATAAMRPEEQEVPKAVLDAIIVKSQVAGALARLSGQPATKEK